MLYDAQGRPLSTSRRMPEASRDAGAFRGSLSHWRGPQIQRRDGTSREREVIQRRAADLMANDWSANATVDTITSNAVGTGLLPKASIPAARLGIAPDTKLIELFARRHVHVRLFLIIFHNENI